MQSIKLRSRVGHDGRLKLDIPIGLADIELEVLVVLHPVAPAPGTPEERGWSPGFLSRRLAHGLASRWCVANRVNTKIEKSLLCMKDGPITMRRAISNDIFARYECLYKLFECSHLH
jgi:hypothetical protein